jgi:MraZ protein
VRHFFSSGRELECDRQGRFLVPGNLRSYANLGKDVVLAGALKRVEVWSKDEWERYNAMEDEDREKFTASMAELGI